MPVTETGTRARQPDSSGYAVTPDGLRLYYEIFGSGTKPIVLLPANPISHSRLWKAQVHYLARHFRVVAYDGRGNGLSDHPNPKGKWLGWWHAQDCRTVMDATGTQSAVLVGICSDGVYPAVQLAAYDPDRVRGIVAIGTGVPHIGVPLTGHFEQNFHVAHRLRRHGAGEPTAYSETTPDRLARQMAERLQSDVAYAPVEAGGALRAAQLIAPLFEQGHA